MPRRMECPELDKPWAWACGWACGWVVPALSLLNFISRCSPEAGSNHCSVCEASKTSVQAQGKHLWGLWVNDSEWERQSPTVVTSASGPPTRLSVFGQVFPFSSAYQNWEIELLSDAVLTFMKCTGHCENDTFPLINGQDSDLLDCCETRWTVASGFSKESLGPHRTSVHSVLFMCSCGVPPSGDSRECTEPCKIPRGTTRLLFL